MTERTSDSRNCTKDNQNFKINYLLFSQKLFTLVSNFNADRTKQKKGFNINPLIFEVIHEIDSFDYGFNNGR